MKSSFSGCWNPRPWNSQWKNPLTTPRSVVDLGVRVLEHDDVAASRIVEVVRDLVDQHAVALLQGGLHRRAGGRRGLPQDRQPDRPGRAQEARLPATQVEEILEYVNERETIEGAPHLKAEHLPVFDCAFKPANGVRSIHYMGHVRMMGAIQPFISGAISKTVNMPEAATAEEIEQVYLEGWKLGLKAIAIYRDNSKRSQPLSTGKKTAGRGRSIPRP